MSLWDGVLSASPSLWGGGFANARGGRAHGRPLLEVDKRTDNTHRGPTTARSRRGVLHHTDTTIKRRLTREVYQRCIKALQGVAATSPDKER